MVYHDCNASMNQGVRIHEKIISINPEIRHNSSQISTNQSKGEYVNVISGRN